MTLVLRSRFSERSCIWRALSQARRMQTKRWQTHGPYFKVQRTFAGRMEVSFIITRVGELLTSVQLVRKQTSWGLATEALDVVALGDCYFNMLYWQTE